MTLGSPRCTRGDEGFPDNSNTFNKLNQIAPRLGLVWDPGGDNVQTIRAAPGIYCDSPKLWQYGRPPLNAPFGNTMQVNNPASFSDPWAAADKYQYRVNLSRVRRDGKWTWSHGPGE